MNIKTFILLIIGIACSSLSIAQTSFKEISILSDTSLYTYSKNNKQYLNENYFFVKIQDPQQIFEITLYPEKDKNITSIQLLPASDMIIIDSVVNINNKFFRGRIKLKNQQHSSHTNLLLNISTTNEKHVEEIKLFPFYETGLLMNNSPIDLYAGEEKTIEIPVVNSSNLQIPNDLVKTADYDYSMSAGDNSLKILIRPNTVGSKELTLNLKTINPFLNSSGQLSYTLPSYIIHFIVKPSRLDFINMDKTDFFLDSKSEDSEEIQVSQKKGLEPGKIYRVENQLESGGKLIAEIYTKSAIGDNKMLCTLRPYSYHNENEGYLYVKLANDAKYITNFNVLQKPAIDNISILHEGEDWSPIAIAHPGENIQIKIEGKGLAKTKFQFSNCTNVKQDSSRIFDDVVFYSFTIPININKKTVYIEMNQKRTKYELIIKENQHPKDLDFVMINYGLQNSSFTSPVFNKPVLDPHPINDINISFNPAIIDQKEELYGKQYLDFEFKIYNNKNDLIEDQKLENIAVCPDDSSPRGDFYDQKDCFKSIINVNDYLLHKTYELEGWSKVEIIARHSASKYSEPGYSRRVIIIKQKFTSFDLQASFPAGLLIKSFNTKGIGELSGLSIAFLAQMSFYEKEGIRKIKPYKIGAGFMALNIFNLESSGSQPDVAAVVIGSLLPLKAESKFNFPLYFGLGYTLKSGQWITLLGPGVQFNF